jgi:hypothetical protein
MYHEAPLRFFHHGAELRGTVTERSSVVQLRSGAPWYSYGAELRGTRVRGACAGNIEIASKFSAKI